jgi:hypothetical protein
MCCVPPMRKAELLRDSFLIKDPKNYVRSLDGEE